MYHVECRKCNFCLQNRRSDWSIRLLEEMKDHDSGYFITLTYADKYLPFIWEDDVCMGVELSREHLKRFHRSLKQEHRRSKHEDTLKYYSTGEYGTRFGRPHYHSIVFGLSPNVLNKLINGGIWGKGMVYVGSVTADSIGYVTKYLIDKEEDPYNEDTKQKPFNMSSLCSLLFKTKKSFSTIIISCLLLSKFSK